MMADYEDPWVHMRDIGGRDSMSNMNKDADHDETKWRENERVRRDSGSSVESIDTIRGRAMMTTEYPPYGRSKPTFCARAGRRDSALASISRDEFDHPLGEEPQPAAAPVIDEKTGRTTLTKFQELGLTKSPTAGGAWMNSK